MRLEIIIDKKHGIGLETIEALANELNRQLTVKFSDLSIRVATIVAGNACDISPPTMADKMRSKKEDGNTVVNSLRWHDPDQVQRVFLS